MAQIHDSLQTVKNAAWRRYWLLRTRSENGQTTREYIAICLGLGVVIAAVFNAVDADAIATAVTDAISGGAGAGAGAPDPAPVVGVPVEP